MYDFCLPLIFLFFSAIKILANEIDESVIPVTEIKNEDLERLTGYEEDSHFQYDENQLEALILNSTNFDDTIIYGSHFIKFFAPWCGHCQQLAPIWLQLSEYYRKNNEAQISKVDCTVSADICDMHNIRSYPTLLFFHDGKFMKDYSGERDFEAMKDFVNMNVEELKKQSAVNVLNEENFYESLDMAFVLFYIPTCPHCQNVFSIWRQLFRESIIYEKATKIAMVDCHKNRNLCMKERVLSYPAFIFYKNKIRIDVYRGPRELPSFDAFINEMSIQSVDPKFIGELQSYIINLELDDFSSYKNFLFVKFFIPWCSFCKTIAPVWEESAELMAPNSMIKFAQVDCSLFDYVCKKYQIEGYPTMKLFLNGNFLDFYTGEHTASSIINYSNIVMSQHTEL